MTFGYMRVKEEEGIHVDQHKLRRFVSQVFQGLDVPEEDAAIAADALVLSDLRGVDSHGVAHVTPNTWYVKAIRDGAVNPRPQIRMVQETPTTALIESDRGLGMVVGHRAMQVAIAKARQVGASFVAVRNSRHYGMAAYYAMLALPHDMIGISMTNAGRQVVPTFGREAKYGTNPISLAAPAGEEPAFVLDMATTTVAGGKLEIAERLEEAIPLGWALDEEARPTQDPRVAMSAHKLLPLGGTRELGSHKGYGLAMMVEILCGVLSGTVAAFAPLQGGVRGHFFGAINIASFRPVEEFKREMDQLLREMKATAPIKGQERVFVAGEIEHEIALERAANGIPLHRSIIEGFRELSRQLHIPYDLE